MILDAILLLAVLCLGVCCLSQREYIKILENQIFDMKHRVRWNCGSCENVDSILEVVD